MRPQPGSATQEVLVGLVERVTYAPKYAGIVVCERGLPEPQRHGFGGHCLGMRVIFSSCEPIGSCKPTVDEWARRLVFSCR
jgi:hypothetical protein